MLTETTFTEKVKAALRVTHSLLDEMEIYPLILAAEKELQISGVAAISEDDPLILRAVTAYCKWQFGYDNPDSEKNRAIFESIRNLLTQTQEYSQGAETEGGGNAEME